MKQKKIALLLLLAAPMVLASCNNTQSSSSSSEEPEKLLPATEGYEGASFASNGASDYSLLDEAKDTSAISGVRSFVGESAAKRTGILGALEKYAVDNAITGLPIFENGGKALYANRLQIPANSYITGYGWGILREGSYSGPLAGDTNAETASYYHTFETDDPATLLFLNADGSVVSDLNAYVAGGYFGTKMGEDKKSYDWYGYLSSKDRPYLVVEAKDGTRTAHDVSGDGNITIGDEEVAKANATSDIWRVYVRTGAAGGVAYRNASKDADRKAFDNKAVELKDYVDAFRILLCGKYSFYRGNELAGQTGQQAIVGASKYYNATASLNWDDPAAKTAFEGVGIESGTDAVGDYIDIQLGAPANRFYAMYNISSSLYSPINGDFFNLVTGNGANPLFYQSFNTDKTFSPVDNTLSVGPYYIAKWESGKNFQFARNNSWYERLADDTIYNFPGVNVDVLEAQKNDPEAAFKQFLADKLDSASIPSTQIKAYGNDPRAREVTGNSVFKLNVNSCDQKQWDALFGKEGSVSPHASDAAQRKVKPWMSNPDFIKGLFYSIDRNTLATNTNNISSINYFSSNYMSDPEGGVSYNTTEEHAAALVDFWGETRATDGFSITESQAKFDAAIEALLTAKAIKAGDTLTIETWWQSQSNIDVYGSVIKSFVEDAFNNSEKAKANNLTLDLQNFAPEVWSDVYYKHLMTGDFDLGFGSISGNSLDPLNFMEVLKSDNSSGFTLNWGPDTAALDLEYDTLGNGVKEKYSFDLLWGAADHGVMAYNGYVIPAVALAATGPATVDADGNMTLTFAYSDAISEMARRAEGNDASAEKVLSYVDADNCVIPLEFEISDDKTIDYEFAAEDDVLAEGVKAGTLIGDNGVGEDLGIAAPTITLANGTLTVVLPGDVTAIALDESGYLDIYYLAYSFVAGNSSVAYACSEIYLG